MKSITRDLVKRRPGRMRSVLSIFMAAFLLTSCLLDPDRNGSAPVWDGSPGFVTLNLGLERNQNQVLSKASAADTTFGLDSLIVVLTATGADTVVQRISISGRPDTGAIQLSPLTFTLNPLLNWKARFYTIDTTVSPLRRDTVHFDSVIFAVKPADTAFVTKTVSAAFSVLRVRFMSTTRDSLGSGVRYLKLIVNGVKRDSLDLFGTEFSAVWFPTLDTGYIAQDSGRIHKSIDSGRTWYPLTSGSTTNFNSISFPTASVGYVAGANGAIRKTINGGSSWSGQTSGTTQRINRIFFINTTTGYAAADSGIILKTINGGTNWTRANGKTGWAAQTSGVSSILNDVAFVGLTTGVSVGQGGVIRRTTTAGAAWGSITSPVTKDLKGVSFGSALIGWTAGDSGKVLRTADAGAIWAAQTSNSTDSLAAVHAFGTSTVWGVGHNESMIRTTNGGTNWVNRPSGWLPKTSGTANNLTSVNFTNTSTGWAFGSAGTILKTANYGTNWAAQASGTTQNLSAGQALSTSIAYAVGDSETVVRTTNGGTNWSLSPSGWYAQTSTTTDTLNAVSFGTSTSTGWAAGQGGKIVKTTTYGNTWAAQTSNTTQTLRDLQALSTTSVVAVGDSETVGRTANGGTNWNFARAGWLVKTSGISNAVNGVRFFNNTTGWAVADSGKILKTIDRGETWVAQTNDKKKPLRSLHIIDVNRVIAVGDSGIIKRTVNGGTNWTTATNTVTSDLRSVFLVGGISGWAVGGPNGAGVIRRTADSGYTWAEQLRTGGGTFTALNAVHSSGTRVLVVGDGGRIYRRSVVTSGTFDSIDNGAITAENLYGVHMVSNNVAYIVGQGGLIARCSSATNVGWVIKTSGTTQTLRNIFMKGTGLLNTDTGYVVGDSGIVLRTHNSGSTWTKLRTGITDPLNSVHFITNKDTVYAVGAAGKIIKTLAGGTWSGRTPQKLNSVHLYSTTRGFAVGDSGTILRTMSTGVSWVPLSTTNNKPWNGVYSNGVQAWAVGDSGKIGRIAAISTETFTNVLNGAINTQKLNAVHFTTSSVGYIVGDGGLIARCSNAANDNWVVQTSPTTENLRHVFFKGAGAATDTGYVVGDNGTILHTTNSGTNWTKLVSGTSQRLLGIQAGAGGAMDTAYVTGANGTILKTNNRGRQWSNKVSKQQLKNTFFYSTTSGFAVGDSGTIIRTTTSGVLWKALNSGTTERLNGVFSDVTRAWAVGNNGVVRYRAAVTDSTTTWTTLASTPGATQLNAVHFTSATVGYAVGVTGGIFKTTNNGTSWTTQTSGTTQNLTSVNFRGNGTLDTGYISGTHGTLLVTVNGGTNWTALITGTTKGLNSVRLVPAGHSDTAYAVGEDGTIIKTVNKGASRSGKSTRQFFRGVHFSSATTGYIVGDSGTITKTTDSGTTWTPQTSGTTHRLNGVFFRSTTLGWAVGATGTILKTTNGGTNWTAQTSYSLKSLKRVHFVSDDTGWVAGDTGTILSTVNGGTNWTAQYSPSTQNLLGVYANNRDSAFVVGANGTILKTNDGGSTRPRITTTQNLNSIFARGDSLYVVGNAAQAYRSRDGGVTWTQLTGAVNNLNSVFSTGNNSYMVGDNGEYKTIAHTTADSALVTRISNSTNKLRAAWGSPTIGSNKVFMVGDSGTLLLEVAPLTDTAFTLSGSLSETFRDVHCAGTSGNTCWLVGANETVLRTVDGLNWYLMSKGSKIFDFKLHSKYLKTGVSNTVVIQAIDRPSPLRGYEKILNLTIGAGQDSTINAAMTKCGYGGLTPSCTP